MTPGHPAFGQHESADGDANEAVEYPEGGPRLWRVDDGELWWYVAHTAAEALMIHQLTVDAAGNDFLDSVLIDMVPAGKTLRIQLDSYGDNEAVSKAAAEWAKEPMTTELQHSEGTIRGSLIGSTCV